MAAPEVVDAENDERYVVTMSVRRWTLVLACTMLIGLTFFFRIGYDETAGSQSFEFVVTNGDSATPSSLMVSRFESSDLRPTDVTRSSNVLYDDQAFVVFGESGEVAFDGQIDSHLRVKLVGSPMSEVVVFVDDVKTYSEVVAAGEEDVALVIPFTEKPATALPLVAFAFILLSLPLGVVLERQLASARFVSGWGSLIGATVISLVVAVFVMAAVPVRGASLERYDVTVESDGSVPAGSLGKEVWVGVETADGVPLDPGVFESTDDWELRSNFWIDTEASAPVRMSELMPRDAMLVFNQYPYGGNATVNVNGQLHSINLFDETPGELRVPLSDLAGSRSTRSVVNGFLSKVAEMAVLALTLLACASWWQRKGEGDSKTWVQSAFVVCSKRFEGHRARLNFFFVIYSGALLFAWGSLLLVFWAGIISPDALAQVLEYQVGDITNWHPWVSTLLIGVLYSIFNSTWLLVFVVVAGLSLICGRILAHVAIGYSKGGAWIGLVLVAVHPVVGGGFLTFGKDSIFQLGLVAFTFFTWRTLSTKGDWLVSFWRLLLFFISAILVISTRHNGWPVVMGSLAILLLLIPARRRRVLGLFALCFVMMVGIQGPLPRALKVDTGRPAEAVVWGFHVAAHVSAGTNLTEEQRGFISNFPFVDPEGPYYCNWAAPLQNFQASREELDRAIDQMPMLRSIAIDLALERPSVTWDHIRCSSSIYWSIRGANDENLYLTEWFEDGRFVIYTFEDNISLGGEDSASPRLAKSYYDLYSALPPILQRPALYRYLLIGSAFLLAVRRKSLVPMMLCVPMAIEIVSLTPFNLSPHPRLDLATYVFACMLVPGLFLASLQPGSKVSNSAEEVNGC